MIDLLKKIASEFKIDSTKKIFEKRIDKFAEDLASKDILLIDVVEMESMFEPDMVEVLDTDSSIKKIVLEK